MDYSFLYDEEATEREIIEGYQELINTGMAWRLEGSVGRTAMDMIEAGVCTLGEEGHRDFWGNYVPSKHEVMPGTKGSQEYVDQHRPKVEFGTLHEDGTLTNQRAISSSDIRSCPHFILMPEHYREDGTCRCNDPEATVMEEWGYHWDGKRWI